MNQHYLLHDYLNAVFNKYETFVTVCSKCFSHLYLCFNYELIPQRIVVEITALNDFMHDAAVKVVYRFPPRQTVPQKIK